MDLPRFAHLIRQYILLVIVTLVVGAAIGYFTSSRVALYSSAATIYVGPRQVTSDQQTRYGVAGFDQILATLAAMLPSPVITRMAVRSTRLPRSSEQVSAETTASVITGTNLIVVTVTDTDPVVATELVNGVVNAFVAQEQSYDPSTPGRAGSLPNEPAYVFQPAQRPGAPLSTGATRHLVLGAILGLAVSILMILLLDYLDLPGHGPKKTREPS